MQLTTHFSLAEMTRTSVRGILNVPGERERERMQKLCEFVLEPVRSHFDRPVIIHSGYRSPMVNDRVGGAMNSQHVLGEAADFHVHGVDHFSVVRWIAQELQFDQLILEFVSSDGVGGWVHVSYVDYRAPRKQILEAVRGPVGRTVYRRVTDLSQLPVI